VPEITSPGAMVKAGEPETVSVVVVIEPVTEPSEVPVMPRLLPMIEAALEKLVAAARLIVALLTEPSMVTLSEALNPCRVERGSALMLPPRS